MAISLKDNLTSSYFNAAHKLYSKKARRRIVAYVESYDDVAFWRTPVSYTHLTLPTNSRV